MNAIKEDIDREDRILSVDDRANLINVTENNEQNDNVVNDEIRVENMTGSMLS